MNFDTQIFLLALSGILFMALLALILDYKKEFEKVGGTAFEKFKDRTVKSLIIVGTGSAILLVASYVLSFFDYSFDPINEIIITTIFLLVTAIVSTFWNRYRLGDLV
jgi:hypothetical protein